MVEEKEGASVSTRLSLLHQPRPARAMPPIANTDPTLLPSDDEDEDFVASDSGDSSSDSEDDHPSKRPKVAETPIEPACARFPFVWAGGGS